jgi:hypothetical protein
MNPDEPYFIRIAELAELADVYPELIGRLLYRGTISADAQLKAGMTFQPMFHSSNIDKLLAAIREYKSAKNPVAA